MREQTLKERIERLSMPEPNTGCWLWIASGRSNQNGIEYGRLEVTTDGSCRKVAAHRVSYEVFKGPIPNGLNVLHKCDVGCCVNPDHLFLGTQVDNMKDCYAKGRIRNGRGVCLPKVKTARSQKCSAAWGTRWCLNCGRFLKRYDQRCLIFPPAPKSDGGKVA